MSHTIIFFGTEEFSAASLQALIDAHFTIAAVVTKPDTPKGRGRKLVPPTVKLIAQRHNIPVWQPSTLNEITADITALQPVAGVLVSFGKIIPQSIINLFTPGIINVHPSKLPLYRGPSPIESAILHGDKETGVSIMQLSAKMDAGPVYHFTPYPLSGTETQPQLYDTLAQLGGTHLVQTLPSILDGTLLPQPQDETRATYCHLIKKSDSFLDVQKSALLLEREIRAYKSWPGTKTTLHGHEVSITSAHVVTTPAKTPGTLEILDDTSALLSTADGTLSIDTLKPAGRNEMSIQAFINGYIKK